MAPALDVLPCSPGNNGLDVRLRDSECSGNASVAISRGGAPSNLENVRRGKPRVTVPFALGRISPSGTIEVRDVLFRGYPLEIRESVVGLVEVAMVGFLALFGWAKKLLKHEPVNVETLVSSEVIDKANLEVSTPNDSWAHDPRWASESASSASGPIVATGENPPEVRNLIAALKPGDRLPSFLGSVLVNHARLLSGALARASAGVCRAGRPELCLQCYTIARR